MKKKWLLICNEYVNFTKIQQENFFNIWQVVLF